MLRQFSAKVSLRYLFRNGFVLLFSLFRKAKRKIYGLFLGVTVPASLFIYTTQECNLRCKGCISAGYSVHPVDTEMLVNLVKSGHKLGVNSFIFLGGEPLTPASAQFILSCAQKYPFSNFNLVTNGTLIDQQTAQKLQQVPNLLLFVSIDGLKNYHDTRRGKHVFEQITAGLQTLAQYRIPFFTITTVTQINYYQVLSKRFLRSFREYGCLGQVFLPYLINGCEVDAKYELSPKQWCGMSDRINRLRTQITDFTIIDVFKAENRFGGCRAASRSLTITADGYVQPCPALMFSMDNIKEKSLLACLRSPLMRFMIRLKQANPSECLLIGRRTEMEDFLTHCPTPIHNNSSNVNVVLQEGFQKVS